MHQDLTAYAGCVSGAATAAEVEALLVGAGFEQVRVTPKTESADFIRGWFPGQGFEAYIASAVIEAVKPFTK